MLRFERNETKAVCKVAGPLYEFELTFNAGSDWAASLLVAHFQERLHAAVQQARAEAYRQGWKDAKAKRPKKTWWPGTLP